MSRSPQTSVPDEPVRHALSPDERVLWSGRPRQGWIVRGSDAFLVPFSLMWCGFAVFWEWSVLHLPNAPGFFGLWGIPFVAVGVYLVVGRFVVDAMQRTRTSYAVTDERVLIVSGLAVRRIQSLNLRTLGDLVLTEKRSGEGSIAFGRDATFSAVFGGASTWPGAAARLAPRFDAIPQARSVYELIRQAQRVAR